MDCLANVGRGAVIALKLHFHLHYLTTDFEKRITKLHFIGKFDEIPMFSTNGHEFRLEYASDQKYILFGPPDRYLEYMRNFPYNHT